MKIWNKGTDNDARIDAFTVGNDRELDLMLAPYDIEGSIAHITMLSRCGLIPAEELPALKAALEELRDEALQGNFVIRGEDVHSASKDTCTIRTRAPSGISVPGRSGNDSFTSFNLSLSEKICYLCNLWKRTKT